MRACPVPPLRAPQRWYWWRSWSRRPCWAAAGPRREAWTPARGPGRWATARGCWRGSRTWAARGRCCPASARASRTRTCAASARWPSRRAAETWRACGTCSSRGRWTTRGRRRSQGVAGWSRGRTRRPCSSSLRTARPSVSRTCSRTPRPDPAACRGWRGGNWTWSWNSGTGTGACITGGSCGTIRCPPRPSPARGPPTALSARTTAGPRGTRTPWRATWTPCRN